MLAVTASMLLTAAGGAIAGHDFDDVPDDHEFHEEISWLVDEGATEGYDDGEFKPGRVVTRQAAAAFLYRLAGEPDRDFSNDFSDVPEDHEFHDEISWAAEQGITEGYEDNTFRPGTVVTRQAAAAFIFRAVGEPEGTWDSDFDDVDEGHPFYRAISWMATEDITEGYDDGEFKPGAPVTRQAAAAFLNRTVEDAGYTILDEEPAPGEPADLDATPDEATNPVDTDHTVTATVTDAEGAAVADDSLVRFEVYEDNEDRDQAESPLVSSDSAVVETTDGEAVHTYSHDAPRYDTIVACSVETSNQSCTQGDDLERDPVSGEFENIVRDVNDVVEKTWEERAAATLTLEPGDDTNDPRQPHTVGATLLDQADEPVENGEVRFELYRDEAEAEGETDTGYTLADVEHSTTAEAPAEGEEGPDAGTTSYTYNEDELATDGDHDVIVACVVEEGDTAEDGETSVTGDLDEAFCAELTEEGDEGDEIVTGVSARDDRAADDATKSWDASNATVTLSQANDTNPAGSDHTVTATVEAFDDAIEGEQVSFEVFRQYYDENDEEVGTLDEIVDDAGTADTDDNGEAEFTYTGPTEAEFTTQEASYAVDTIVGCIGETDDCAQVTEDQIDLNPATESRDQIEKTWTTTTVAGQYTGQLVAHADEADTIDVDVDGNGIERFDYSDPDGFASNDYIVNGETVDQGEFETAVDNTLDGEREHTIAIDYDPSQSESSTFDLTYDETGEISGLVADVSDAQEGDPQADGAEPIEGATVTAYDGEDEVATTTTDTDGTYTLESVAPGTYEVEATADGYESSSQEVTVNTTESVEDVDFGLYPTAEAPAEAEQTVSDAGDVTIQGDYWVIPVFLDDPENGRIEFDVQDAETIVFERPDGSSIELGPATTSASWWGPQEDDGTSSYDEGVYHVYYELDADDATTYGVDAGWYQLDVEFNADGELIAVNDDPYPADA